jgi:hypothetical protein
VIGVLLVSLETFSRYVNYFISDFISTNYNSVSSLKMRHFFFHEERPTLQLSYQLWTTSTSISLRLPPVTDTLSRSRLHSRSEQKPLTATTTKLISPRYTGSRWVCILLPYNFIFLYITSITPSTQAPLLQDRRMGEKVDRPGRGDCPYGIQEVIRILGCKLGRATSQRMCFLIAFKIIKVLYYCPLDHFRVFRISKHFR